MKPACLVAVATITSLRVTAFADPTIATDTGARHDSIASRDDRAAIGITRVA